MTTPAQLAKAEALRPRLTVIGVGGAGCNAINNMISAGLTGVNFVAANTDAQSLVASSAEFRIQLGANLTEGLGAGSKPEIGEAAAEEALNDIREQVKGSHMVFVAAGMGGGTGTGAAAVIARIARELGILTVGVVTKPFLFEGARRMRTAEEGIARLRDNVDTLIVIPNQNLFRIANDKTTFSEAFILADQVLYSGVACIVDLIVKEGLINLDFADVRTVMSGMGTAMMGTGEASGPGRATVAAEEAISNPLLDDVTLRGAKGLLLSITGGRTLTLFEVDEAASRVRQEVDSEANVIVGATFDETLQDSIRVSIVASGMARLSQDQRTPMTAARTPPPAPAFTPAAVVASEPPPVPPLPAHAPQSEGDVYRRLTHAIHGEAPQTHQSDAQHGANSSAISSEPGAGFATPPPLPTNRTWMAPGQVRIEEQPDPSAYAPAEWQPPFDSAAHQPPPMDPAFAPMPPAEFRRTRRMPEIEDFPVVGQRDYLAKRPGGWNSAPNVAPAPPPAAEPEQKRKGWFGRFAGRAANQSDSRGRGATRQMQNSVAKGSTANCSKSEPSVPADSPSAHAQKSQEAPILPGFFGGRR